MDGLLLLVSLLAGLAGALEMSGPVNRFYSIPFYFGSRVKDWNNSMSYYED